MKKQLAVILAFALLLPLFAGCQSAIAAQETTIQSLISREEALNIALADAGLTAQEIYDLEIDLEKDRGAWHYDVDFEKNGRDYDYEIHAETGEILRKDIPAQTPAATPAPDTTPVNPPAASETPEIPGTEPVAPTQRLSREEARNIALTHAGLTADQVRDLDTELDKERGVWLYEVDFEADGYEYEYEIHAETGEILRSEKEWD